MKYLKQYKQIQNGTPVYAMGKVSGFGMPTSRSLGFERGDVVDKSGWSVTPGADLSPSLNQMKQANKQQLVTGIVQNGSQFVNNVKNGIEYQQGLATSKAAASSLAASNKAFYTPGVFNGGTSAAGRIAQQGLGATIKDPLTTSLETALGYSTGSALGSATGSALSSSIGSTGANLAISTAGNVGVQAGSTLGSTLSQSLSQYAIGEAGKQAVTQVGEKVAEKASEKGIEQGGAKAAGQVAGQIAGGVMSAAGMIYSGIDLIGNQKNWQIVDRDTMKSTASNSTAKVGNVAYNQKGMINVGQVTDMQSLYDKAGNTTNFMDSVGVGAGLGGVVGSIVPGIGNAIGAAAGAIVGGIAGLFTSNRSEQAEAQRRAEDINDMTSLWNKDEYNVARTKNIRNEYYQSHGLSASHGKNAAFKQRKRTSGMLLPLNR